MLRSVLVVLAVVALAGSVLADPRPRPREFTVAVLLDPHGRGDHAFNDSALAGIDAAKKRGRIAVALRPAPRPADARLTIDRVVSDAPDLIVGVGPLYADAFREAATRHPKAR